MGDPLGMAGGAGREGTNKMAGLSEGGFSISDRILIALLCRGRT